MNDKIRNKDNIPSSGNSERFVLLKLFLPLYYSLTCRTEITGSGHSHYFCFKWRGLLFNLKRICILVFLWPMPSCIASLSRHERTGVKLEWANSIVNIIGSYFHESSRISTFNSSNFPSSSS